MNNVVDLFRPIPFPSRDRLRNDASAQAFTLLRIGFVLVPLLMGIDKFAKVLQNDWPMYLAGVYNDILPGTAQTAMYIIGGVEIAAALIVLVIPRFGSLLVAGWLGGIVASLIIVGGYGDIVLRDLALLVVALAASRLAWVQPTGRDEWTDVELTLRGQGTSPTNAGQPTGNFALKREAVQGRTALPMETFQKSTGERWVRMVMRPTDIDIVATVRGERCHLTKTF